MKPKKISRKLMLLLLTAGASLIIGLLSFGGMFALWPVLPIAFATFVLSIAYEAEIYLQNIKGAIGKLFKHNSLQRQLAKDYLRDNFPDITDEHGPHDEHAEHDEHEHHEAHATDLPQFFKDYQTQLKLLHVFGHKRLNKESQARKKRVEKTLRDMEKWFSLQLFAADQAGRTPYEATLRTWLIHTDREQKRQDTIQLLNSYQNSFWWAKYFSVFAGVFMGLGTTYLLVETFSIIPLFAAISVTTWPLLILPMAAIAGTAYGLLTFNSITDMIMDDTLREWLKYLGLVSRVTDAHNASSDEHKPTDTLLSRTTAWVLILLALGLTICTAGTWWTVVKETRPLFTWIAKIPSFIMGVINPIITGLSAVVFNLQNTRESLELILGLIAQTGDALAYVVDLVKNGYSRLRQHENIFQVFNPFRILLFITITPLRVLLFLGHLVSIGVTADRLPGVSQKFSALLGFISELFEDLHYFFGHQHADEHEHEEEATAPATAHGHGHHHECDGSHGHDAHGHAPEQDPQAQQQQRRDQERKHTKALLNERLGKGHGHNHDLDIPTAALKAFFTYVIPLYSLSALWDWGFSNLLNSRTRENHKPYPLSYSEAAEKIGLRKEKEVNLPDNAHYPSNDWKLTHTVYRIQRFMEKESPSTKEREALGALQGDLWSGAVDDAVIMTKLSTTKNQLYPGASFFGASEAPPTHAFLAKDLQQRIGLRSGG